MYMSDVEEKEIRQASRSCESCSGSDWAG